MAGNLENTKIRILDAAYGVFYKEGFTRARLDVIAAAACVTKRTLYYHFASKDALLAAVLEAQHELALTRIDASICHSAGDPEAVLRTLFGDFAAWAGKPGWQGSGFTRAVVELADMPGHPARAVARRHKAAIETRLAEKLGGPDIARQIMLLIEGCHSLILIHNDPGYAQAAAAAALVLVERSTLLPAG